MMTYDAIVLGGGQGKRLNLGYNKILYTLNGRYVLEYALEPFVNDPRCVRIIVVLSEEDGKLLKDVINHKKIITTLGGEHRKDSVYQGLLKTQSSYVLIHDGARPFVQSSVIDRVLHCLKTHASVTAALPAKDTMAKTENERIVQHVNRRDFMRIQTPQGFWRDTIIKAYETPLQSVEPITCDVSLVKAAINITGATVHGDEKTMKLTTREDATILEGIAHVTNRS